MFLGKFNCLESDNILRICKIREEKRIILSPLIKMFEHPYTQTPCYRKLLQCEFQAVKTVLFQICNIIIGFAFLIGCFIF